MQEQKDNKMYRSNCRNCGEAMNNGRRYWKRFCGSDCRKDYHILAVKLGEIELERRVEAGQVAQEIKIPA